MSSGAVPANPSPAGATTTPAEASPSRGAAEASGTTRSAEAPSPGDYLGRISAGGEFATAEVQKYQSRATTAEEKLRKMGDLASWAEQVGPETITTAVSRYSALRQDPRLGRIIQQYETTGEIPKSNGYEPFEEVEEPDPRDVRIRQLEERVASQETSVGAQAMTAHVEKFFKDFPLPQEVRVRASEKAMSQVRQWHQLGPVGVKSIQNLQTPGGYDTVKGLLLSQLTPEEILQAGKDAFLRSRGKAAEFATDVPSSSATTGREIPPELKSTLSALQWAREHPERI